MDVQRIKELLHAWRPGQELPPEVAKAKELAAADADLSAWLDNERAFDQAFADRFNSVQAPEGLLDSILAAHEAGEGNVVPFSPEAPRTFVQGTFMRYVVSIAASLLIVAGIFAFATHNGASSEEDLASFIDATVIQALSGQMLDAPDMEKVRKGLEDGFAPAPGYIPEPLNNFTPVRYGVIRTQQGNIGQIGFSGKNSYRLIVMERRCLGGCTATLSKPVMYDLGDKLAVAWAKGQQVYILVSDRSGDSESVIRGIVETDGTSM